MNQFVSLNFVQNKPFYFLFIELVRINVPVTLSQTLLLYLCLSDLFVLGREPLPIHSNCTYSMKGSL